MTCHNYKDCNITCLYPPCATVAMIHCQSPWTSGIEHSLFQSHIFLSLTHQSPEGRSSSEVTTSGNSPPEIWGNLSGWLLHRPPAIVGEWNGSFPAKHPDDHLLGLAVCFPCHLFWLIILSGLSHALDQHRDLTFCPHWENMINFWGLK